MELNTKKIRRKNLSDPQVIKKKYSTRILIANTLEKKKDTPQHKEYLSVSLSNSLKKLSTASSAPKLTPVHLISPKILSGYLPHAFSSTRLSKDASKPSIKSSLHNYLSNHPVHPEPKPQMTARIALAYFKNDLNDYERAEILDYTDVYYLGALSSKVKLNPAGINYGFDDERGDYLLVAGDHIAYRYEVLKMLGKGNFGQVALCEDHKRHEKIALKIVRNKKRFNQQATVEIKILQTLRENDIDNKCHVVKIKNYFMFRKHICMTFDQLSMNLFELLHQNSFEGFSLGLIHKFASQLFSCLSYTYKFEIIHCDLKPENIMLVSDDKAEINVIDFGSSCIESERIYTYIQSRFYRAPEIILGIPYTVAIDMWSMGCILAEFYTGYPLFTGESEHDQLLHIMEVLGGPGERVMARATRVKLFFEGDGTVKGLPSKGGGRGGGGGGVKRVPGSRKLKEVLKGAPMGFVDLVRRCLEWDPEIRIKPHEAILHPWIVEEKLQRKGRERKTGRGKKKSIG